MFGNYKYLVIEGNIGAGKTSLATIIAEKYNAKCIFEEYINNPFLEKFYSNPEKYSFQLELSFLAERYQQLKRELPALDLFKSFTVADYYLMKSLIFAKATLSDDEYILYRNIFNIIYQRIPKPDLYVYLHADVEKLLENIQKRGREYELGIQSDYLFLIQKGYFEFFKQHPDLSFLILDITNLNFVDNQRDRELVLNTVFNKNYAPGINRVLL